MIAGDIIYDGELVTDAFHSDMADFRRSMNRLRDTFPSAWSMPGISPAMERHGRNS